MARCKLLNYTAVLLAMLLLLGLCACERSAPARTDVLTQKPTQEGRTQISVLVKYAFTINGFERAVEEKFPNIDLVQVGNYTHDMGVDEYEARLKHDDLTDIVMTWPLDVGEEYWQDRLLDLSGMDFTGRYNISMLSTVATEDGKLYYLPGPAQVRGIVYNKTLFEENGWQVPTDFEGFLALCKTIEDSGIRSIQLGFKNAEVLDTAFVGVNLGDYFTKPEDVQWLADYASRVGSFGEKFGGALANFQRMIDEGIWKPADLDVNYSDREKLFFTRQCAMVEDSVLMTRMGMGQTGSTDEFALMPFFGPGEDNDWARLYMVCYVGMNKQLAEPANKEKFALAKQLLDYISTPEGQTALMSDTGAMFSSLTDVGMQDVPEVTDLQNALDHGRYAIFPTLQNAQGALREGLAGMVRGDMTAAQVVTLVDQANLRPAAYVAPKVLGTATADFSLIETGNFITDAMRKAAGTDVALFLDNGKDGQYNGKGVSGKFYEGDVTEADVGRILPDFKSGDKGVLWSVSMSGADLIETLEYAIAVDNNRDGWFYYFSGLRVQYDPTAQPGSRIGKISTADGDAIDPDKIYTVAIMSDSVPERFVQSREKTLITIKEILTQAIVEAGTISPSKDGRFS